MFGEINKEIVVSCLTISEKKMVELRNKILQPDTKTINDFTGFERTIIETSIRLKACLEMMKYYQGDNSKCESARYEKEADKWKMKI